MSTLSSSGAEQEGTKYSVSRSMDAGGTSAGCAVGSGKARVSGGAAAAWSTTAEAAESPSVAAAGASSSAGAAPAAGASAAAGAELAAGAGSVADAGAAGSAASGRPRGRNQASASFVQALVQVQHRTYAAAGSSTFTGRTPSRKADSGDETPQRGQTAASGCASRSWRSLAARVSLARPLALIAAME